jgi:hypothetical protein
MNTSSSKAIDILRAAILEFQSPMKSKPSKSPNRVIRDVRPDQLTSGAECSFRLSDDFEQSLIYLPVAIDYLKLRTSHDANWSDDFEPAGRGICTFVNAWTLNLNRSHLFDLTVQALEDLLQQWNRRLVADKITPTWKHIVELPIAAQFLDLALQTSRPFYESALFASLFGRWVSDTTDVAGSAALIGFFLFVKRSSDDLLLFRHPLVLNAAFDRSLCSKHWDLAQELLIRSCPASYIVEIKEYLL